MKYLLDEDELAALRSQNKLFAAAHSATLQDLCTRVANSEVLTEGWAKGKPWGCILTNKNLEYCDECPVKDVCPYEWKEWSK